MSGCSWMDVRKKSPPRTAAARSRSRRRADEGGEGREHRVLDGAGGLEEEAEEGRRVELPEAAAEGRGGGHRAPPRPAGEGGADERREGGEAEEDLEQDVVGEGVDGAGGGWGA